MTAYDTIVAALEAHGMKTFVRSDGARSQCPVHAGRSQSLSVRRLDDRAAVKCFAGCDDTDVLAAIGLGVRDLFDQPATKPQAYTPPKLSPWEEALARLGIHNGPSIDHVLHRMEVEERKAAGETGHGVGCCEPRAGEAATTKRMCGDCLTPPSPWSCSCGALRVGGAA